MTNELTPSIKGTIIQDNEDFTIIQEAPKKFVKQMKYKKFWSNIPETEDEMLLLYKVMNEQESELVTPMKNAVGQVITIKNFYMNPYQSFNEETGENDNGVTTTIEDESGIFYATSSKAVYFTMQNINDVFDISGNPDKQLQVKITSTKRDKGDQINLVVEGFKK